MNLSDLVPGVSICLPRIDHGTEHVPSSLMLKAVRTFVPTNGLEERHFQLSQNLDLHVPLAGPYVGEALLLRAVEQVAPIGYARFEVEANQYLQPRKLEYLGCWWHTVCTGEPVPSAGRRASIARRVFRPVDTVWTLCRTVESGREEFLRVITSTGWRSFRYRTLIGQALLLDDVDLGRGVSSQSGLPA